jgi:asparagine N-glycosylation enzyme membrane subunit Stt3
VYIVLSIVLVFFLGVFPNISPAVALAKSDTGIDSNWRDALLWMKNNTPDPFNNPDYFNGYYDQPASGEKYKYPESAYGVMTWWTFGHNITEIAHRIPNSNPHQYGAVSSAKYFVSQNELSGNEIMNTKGLKYVILDQDVAVPFTANFYTRRFVSVVTWAGDDLSRYSEIYYQRASNGKASPVVMYYPEYYYCMSSRLYNFDGQAVVPNNTTHVISYRVENGLKLILTNQVFPTYDQAKEYLGKQTGSNYRIVGISPTESPIPLERLNQYKKVYDSPQSNRADVKIFEYSR